MLRSWAFEISSTPGDSLADERANRGVVAVAARGVAPDRGVRCLLLTAVEGHERMRER